LLQLRRLVLTHLLAITTDSDFPTQPTAAKIADVFGRIELIILSVVFYTVGPYKLIAFSKPFIDLV
jgi:hypothetical protein